MLFEIRKEARPLTEKETIKGLIDGDISVAAVPFEKQTQRIVDCILSLEEGTYHNIKFTNQQFHTANNIKLFLDKYEFGGFEYVADQFQTKEMIMSVLKESNNNLEYGSIPKLFRDDPDIVKYCAEYDEFQIPDGTITPEEAFEIVKHNVGMYENLPGDCYTEELNWYVLRDKAEYEAISVCPNPTYEQLILCYKKISAYMQEEIKDRIRLGDFDYFTPNQKEYIHLL